MDLAALKDGLLKRVSDAVDLDALNDVRVAALGKKGEITAQMKNLGKMEADARKAAGQALNELKEEIATAINQKQEAFEDAVLNARLATEWVDTSQPVKPTRQGHIHPITQTIDEIISIFGEMGFTWAEGPEVEDDWHNFTALNIPTDHPARQMQDTFYMNGHSGDEGSLVLRTHTSPVQVRTMMSQEPPIRVIVPGRTFRCDSDATHSPMFHQVEGLVIDETANMSQLKGCLLEFCRTYFQAPDLTIQFRPSYFPFTEPSAEVDIRCDRSGDELLIGTGNDWMEILGCGMVNPRVLEMAGIDSEKYQGFAFGMGIERIAMLKYGIPDLRTFYDGDVRWIDHYGFDSLNIPNLLRGA